MIGTYFGNDAHFDFLYPEHIIQLSTVHWTPLDIARRAAAFLSVPGGRIMDIGCGVGKFCLTAAFFHQNCTFYGIEQRRELVEIAQGAQSSLGLTNIDFICGNIAEIDLAPYTGLYFFNSFYENIDTQRGIDATVARNEDLYKFYTKLLFRKLEQQPSGCRLVTYHTSKEQVPASFVPTGEFFHPKVRMYIKR
ncbi:MAG: methyltransferase domain-containing protein [Pedobacter sp.]|jgi:SAM-dependent methyltransferase|uniref:methyltransferase domain-containing protein n=1 Tax=Pedobacter sp. TaxID=1411316 RepID=UPI00356190FC